MTHRARPATDGADAGRSATLQDQLRPLLADQRRRWRGGERPFVESYLTQEPALQVHPDAILDFIYQEIVLREATGEVICADEYLQRFPALADQLKVLFEVERVLERGLLSETPTIQSVT